MRQTDEFYFFWGGEFSQWAKYDMTIDGVTYGTCEQYMMAEKARLMGDHEMASRIAAASSPRKQKELGRQVQNFDQKLWDEHKEDVVYRGNIAKFTQHAELKDLLLATGTRTIVEASPDDCVWGIGLAEDDPRALDPEKWRGLNLLGKAIMKVREELAEH